MIQSDDIQAKISSVLSFPRATSEEFSFSRSSAGVKLSFPVALPGRCQGVVYPGAFYLPMAGLMVCPCTRCSMALNPNTVSSAAAIILVLHQHTDTGG